VPIRVQTAKHGLVEFPDGTDEATMANALRTLDKPAAASPAADGSLSKATDFLPMAGGTVGGIFGGPLGAAAGGAAGQGFRSLAENATELPGAIKDILTSGQPLAAAKGFTEGSGLGAMDAAVQGGIQGALAGVGGLVMKAPGALLGAAEAVGVPGASMLGRGLRLLKGGKAMLPKSAPAAANTAEQAAPRATGRLVGARTVKSAEQEMADALAEVRAATASPRITTPPEPNLPAGFTPRSTVPKPRAVAAPKPAPEPTAAAPKRAYFLKPKEELAAAATERVAPLGRPVTINDLPQAWRSRVGQSLTKPDAGLASEASAELTKRGLSPEAALEAVAKNPSLSTSAKLKLREALLAGLGGS
jgi:hypothetical protein